MEFHSRPLTVLELKLMGRISRADVDELMEPLSELMALRADLPISTIDQLPLVEFVSLILQLTNHMQGICDIAVALNEIHETLRTSLDT